jgi:hypothetical protein
VDNFRVEFEYGPTVDGKDSTGPFFTTGDTVVLRLTVPLKPFIPLMVMMKVAEAPLATVWLVGVAIIVKSGVPVTVTETVVECDNDPLVPVTVTV